MVFNLSLDALFTHFQQVVQANPDGTALELPDGLLSYKALDQRSDDIALYLCDKNINSVGLYFAPCKAYFIGLVGAMKAGSVVHPIDPVDPLPSTVDFSWCLSDQHHQETLRSALPSLKIIPIQSLETAPEPFAPCKNLQTAMALHRVKTSGSSGTPSYVTHTRNNVLQHSVETQLAYQYPPQKKHLSLSRHTSTAGINAFWRLILAGHWAVFFDLRHGDAFPSILSCLMDLSTGSLHGPPSVIKAVIQSAESNANARFEHLKLIITGGEQVSPAFVATLSKVFPPPCVLQINYSSTETLHICQYRTTLYEALKLAVIPCGEPYPSREILLLDAQKKPVAAGEIGEIVVRSQHLPLDLHTVNAHKKLCLDPTQPGYQRYYTGDLGRWNEAGLLEHWGRKDRQIKINGVRIDPLPVEKALLSFPGIKDARVFAHSQATGAQLVACIQSTPSYRQADVAAHLHNKLPPTAIPTRWIHVSEIPLLPNGKTDMKALQDLVLQTTSAVQHSTAEVESDLYNDLHQAWEKVLAHRLTADPQSFIAEGGDSLKALSLLAILNTWGFKDLTLGWLAKYPLLSDQARALKALKSSTTSAPQHNNSSPEQLPPQGSPPRFTRDSILRQLGWGPLDT